MKLTIPTLAMTLAITHIACGGALDPTEDTAQQPAPDAWQLTPQTTPTTPVDAPQTQQPQQPQTPPTTPISDPSCTHPSIAADVPLAGASTHAEPTIVERLDPLGCVMDRHITRYNAQGLPAEHTYEFFVPELQFQTYLQVFNHKDLFSYDAQGQLIEHKRFNLDDGTMSFHSQQRYDAQGRLVWAKDANGLPDFPNPGHIAIRTFAYHASGQLQEREELSNGARVAYERFTRDAQGLPLERYVFDYSSNSVKLTTRWQYDAQGRESVIEERGVAGTHATISRKLYNANGNLEQLAVDNLTMGWRDIKRYDAQGQEIYFAQDEDGDDVPEYAQERVEDPTQRTITQTTKYGHDGRGHYSNITIDQERRDAQGRTIYHRRSTQTSRTEYEITTTRSYDAQGFTLERLYTSDQSPQQQPQLRERYDAQERLLWRIDFKVEPTQAAPVQWRRTDLSYNAQGQLIQSISVDLDGTTQTQRLSYDAQGRLVEDKQITSVPGQADSISSHTLQRYQPLP